LDPIEKAIRGALEKGDVEDPEHRQRVYRSVEAALDRAVQANPQLTVERAIARRRDVQNKIREIESEFQPALPEVQEEGDDGNLDAALLDILSHSPLAKQPDASGAMPEWPIATRQVPVQPTVAHPVAPEPASAPPPIAVDPPVEPVAPVPREPTIMRESLAGDRPAAAVGPPVAPRAIEPGFDFGTMPTAPGRAEPELDFGGAMPPPPDDPDISAPVPQSPPEVVAADRIARSREKRRPFAALFFGVALLSLAALGFMFALQTGLLKTPEQRDTSVANPPAQLEGEDFTPAEDATPPLSDAEAPATTWIDVFAPSEPATASAPGDAAAEPQQDDTGAFLRIRSGASGSAIVFDVNQGVLEQLAGKKATFSVAARADGEGTSEISIECNFGELGDCGRKRYEVGADRTEYLFEVTLPDKQPGASGTIAINSDVSGSGKAVDIYEIKAAAQ
jgi:hypothetical protein